jgi:hypothetical protein
MGTRNLTLVKYNKQYVVAQYCQWDGYPEGQGVTVLEFLRDKMNQRKFVAGLKNLVRADDNLVSTLWKSMGADESGLVSLDVSHRFAKAYPSLHRDTGAKILEMIQNSDSVMVNLALDFWDDALFCEWAYEIDLDAETLSVYAGGKNLIKTWAFADLPDNKTFCEELKE